MQILTIITLAKDDTAIIVKAVNPVLIEKTHTSLEHQRKCVLKKSAQYYMIYKFLAQEQSYIFIPQFWDYKTPMQEQLLCLHKKN